MANDDMLREKIKEAYKDSNNVDHNTKVYVTVLVVIVIILIAGYFLFSTGTLNISTNSPINNPADAIKKTTDIGKNLNNIAGNINDIESAIG